MSGSNLILLFDRELPFSDGRHLYNHVNYLLRTDPFQRWTNTATRTCRGVDSFISQHAAGLGVLRRVR